MAKTINISFKGEAAVFAYKPIDRTVLYGKRRRIAFDEAGNECAKASLLADGSLLSVADLPPRDTRRWVASRKLAVVRAVLYQLRSQEEVLETYSISDAIVIQI